jgi:hypothetical protein
MAEEIVGSKEKALNGYGQGGYQGPSSQVPGDKPAELGNKKVAPPTAIAATGDWQTREVSPAQAVPNAFGQKTRNDNAAQIAATLSRKK